MVDGQYVYILFVHNIYWESIWYNGWLYLWCGVV